MNFNLLIAFLIIGVVITSSLSSSPSSSLIDAQLVLTSQVTSGSYVIKNDASNYMYARTTSSSTFRHICASKANYETSSQLGTWLGIGDRCSWGEAPVIATTSTSTSSRYLFSDLLCTKTTSSLNGCTLDRTPSSSSCGSNDALKILCWYQSVGQSSGSQYIRISDDGKNRLEVKDISGFWRAIKYSSSSDSTTASQLCKFFGFGFSSSNSNQPRVYRTTGGSGIYMYSSLRCSSFQSSFSSCTRSTGDLSNAGSNDLGLSCGPMTVAEAQGLTGGGGGGGDGDETVGFDIGSNWYFFLPVVVVFIAVVYSIARKGQEDEEMASTTGATSHQAIQLGTIVKNDENDMSMNNNYNNNNSSPPGGMMMMMTAGSPPPPHHQGYQQPPTPQQNAYHHQEMSNVGVGDDIPPPANGYNFAVGMPPEDTTAMENNNNGGGGVPTFESNSNPPPPPNFAPNNSSPSGYGGAQQYGFFSMMGGNNNNQAYPPYQQQQQPAFPPPPGAGGAATGI